MHWFIYLYSWEDSSEHSIIPLGFQVRKQRNRYSIYFTNYHATLPTLISTSAFLTDLDWTPYLMGSQSVFSKLDTQ